MRTYQIDPRPVELGAGWSLRLLDDGEEMGGGVFPPVPGEKADFDEAYDDAINEGQSWVDGSP
jgi:hypothetical protein